MRRFIIILICLGLASCKITQTNTIVAIVLADRTDDRISNPSSEILIPLLNVESRPNDGVILKYQTIGDVDYTPIYQMELAPSSILENTLQRDSDIKQFYGSIDSLFIRENTKEYTYGHSSILFSVVAHLNKLESLDTTTNKLFLFSDLVEFSDIYDSYANRHFVINSPKKVALQLKEKITIPSTSQIDMYIIYYPKTQEENRLFRAWRIIYEELFKDSNIKIHFGLEQTLHLKGTSIGK